MKPTHFPWARFLPAPPGNRVARATFCDCSACQSGRWRQAVSVVTAGNFPARMAFAARWHAAVVRALYPYRYTA